MTVSSTTLVPRRTLLLTSAWLSLITVVSTLAGLAAVLLLDLGWSPIEVFATVTGVQCVYLLARNKVSGWVVGLASVVAFIIVFARTRLFGDVAVQLFYLAASLQAIRVWLRPNPGSRPAPVASSERGVAWASRRLVLATIPLFFLAWVAAYATLTAIEGVLPFWTSLTTIMSLTAQLYLLGRYVQAWFIYIAADFVYIPLFLSLDLTLTAGLYLVFMVLSTLGLVRFVRQAATSQNPDRLAEATSRQTVA